MKRVISLDIGGKIFHTAASTIESRPETMLAMLLSRHQSNDPLFIDRDSKNFRWILHWYRTSILVDHTTVGVPPEVWDDEIAFYCITVAENDTGLGEQEPARKEKRIREKDDEFARKCKEKRDELAARKDTAIQARRVKYQALLAYIVAHMVPENRTGYDFVQPDERNLDHYTHSYPKDAIFDIPWMHEHMAEFIKYCREYDFGVECAAYDASWMGKHTQHYPPAKFVAFKKKHYYMKLVIWVVETKKK